MKPLSEQLMDLADHTKKIEDTANATREKNRATLEQHRTQLKAEVDTGSKAIVDVANQADASVTAWWDSAVASMDARFASIDAKQAERKAERDAKRAKRRADEAEQDAADLIAFATYAVEASEYAAIDAALARAEAEDLAMR
jgi:hypothetical protein